MVQFTVPGKSDKTSNPQKKKTVQNSKQSLEAKNTSNPESQVTPKVVLTKVEPELTKVKNFITENFSLPANRTQWLRLTGKLLVLAALQAGSDTYRVDDIRYEHLNGKLYAIPQRTQPHQPLNTVSRLGIAFLIGSQLYKKDKPNWLREFEGDFEPTVETQVIQTTVEPKQNEPAESVITDTPPSKPTLFGEEQLNDLEQSLNDDFLDLGLISKLEISDLKLELSETQAVYVFDEEAKLSTLVLDAWGIGSGDKLKVLQKSSCNVKDFVIQYKKEGFRNFVLQDSRFWSNIKTELLKDGYKVVLCCNGRAIPSVHSLLLEADKDVILSNRKALELLNGDVSIGLDNDGYKAELEDHPDTYLMRSQGTWFIIK